MSAVHFDYANKLLDFYINSPINIEVDEAERLLLDGGFDLMNCLYVEGVKKYKFLYYRALTKPELKIC